MLARYMQKSSRVRYASHRREYPGLSLDPMVLRVLTSGIRYGVPRSLAQAFYNSDEFRQQGFDRIHAGDLSWLAPIIQHYAGAVGGQAVATAPIFDLYRQAIESQQNSQERQAAEVAYDVNIFNELVRDLNEKAANNFGLPDFPDEMADSIGREGVRVLNIDPYYEGVSRGDLPSLLAFRQHVFKQLIDPKKEPKSDRAYNTYSSAMVPIHSAILLHGNRREDYFKKYMDFLKQSQEGVDYRPNEMLPEDYYGL